MIKYLISLISIVITITYSAEKNFEGNAFALLKDSSMLGIPLTLIKSTYFAQDKEPSYKNLLHTNIQQIIKENDQIINDLAKILPSDDFWNYLTKTMQEKPLFMLQECHGQSCSLSRFNSPGPRDDAQNTILELVKKHHPNKAAPLTYTSFCSGDLLTDAKILDELIQEGYTSIHINLIDIIYEGYIEQVLKKEQTDYLPWKITPKKGIDWNKIGLTDDLFIKSTLCSTLRIYQLLMLFNTSNTNISVTLYAHVDDYLKDCCYDSNLKSDIIVAIDCIRTAFNAQFYAQEDLKKTQETYLAQQKDFPEEEQKRFLEEATHKYTAECTQEAAIVEQDFVKLCANGVKLFNYAVIKVTQEPNIPWAVISYIIESGKPSVSNFGIWIFEHSQALFQYITK